MAGWKFLYIECSGRKEAAAAAVEGEEEKTGYLGSKATATDAERGAIGLACQLEGNMNFILIDSQASIQSVLNPGEGKPPRSGIEVAIKAALNWRRIVDTTIGWIRSHIGIPGNEAADRLVAFTSIHVEIAGAEEIPTEGGVR